MLRSIALSLALALGLSLAASAAPVCTVPASEGCTCVVDLVDGSPLGELTGIEGDVQKTGTGGYSPVNLTTPIGDGDGVQITTGKGVLTAGSCQSVPLGPQTSIIAKAIGGCGCVKVSELKTPVNLGDALKVGLGVADTTALVVESQKKDDAGPVSP